MRTRNGQSTMEFALTFSAITVPLTFAVIFTSQLLWVWHSVVEFTRDGARYAVTHCYDGGSNVEAYMRTHVPVNIDQDQFTSGTAEISVTYYQRDPSSGQFTEFSCDGAQCSTECVPDAVTVQVTGYQFRRVLTGFGIPPVPLPDFRTSLPVESAGCRPDSTDCVE
jgi:hypothetical protein